MLVSLAEAARRLGLCRKVTLPRLIAEGQIRTARVGKRLKVSVVELERFCRDGEQVRPVVPEKGRSGRAGRSRRSSSMIRERILAIPL